MAEKDDNEIELQNHPLHQRETDLQTTSDLSVLPVTEESDQEEKEKYIKPKIENRSDVEYAIPIVLTSLKRQSVNAAYAPATIVRTSSRLSSSAIPAFTKN
eukprot:m.281240 g.281240  ORF g.281240 m.281240 type:complete len:101 (+) comp40643_c0_seq10:1204-1506(+)